MQQRARDTLESKADGMFRWAYCQLQELKYLKSTRVRSIEQALSSLPVGLDETYERMLSRLDHHDRDEALCMLQWLSFGLTPLSLGELQEARLIDPDGDGCVAWDDAGSIQDIISILGDLVHVDEPTQVVVQGSRWKSNLERDRLAYDSFWSHVRDLRELDNEPDWSEETFGPESDRTKAEPWRRHNSWRGHSKGEIKRAYDSWILEDGKEFTTIRLAHFSVKEYLISGRALSSGARLVSLEETATHALLAQSCLFYLMSYSQDHRKSLSPADHQSFPLLRYAAIHWAAHADDLDDEPTKQEVRFVESNAFLSDWMFARHDSRWRMLKEVTTSTDVALWFSSSIGHLASVRRLLRNGADVNTVDGFPIVGTPLQLASENGYKQVVAALLGAGADVDIILTDGSNSGNTALRVAAANGYLSIVQRLLDAGARTEMSMLSGLGIPTILHAAVKQSRSKIVQMLIEAGCDVNAISHTADGSTVTAIYAAARAEDVTSIGMLLNAGALPNAVSHFVGAPSATALYAACDRFPGPTATTLVELLLQAGASVKLEGPPKGNDQAIIAASKYSDGDVVKALISAGADVNIRCRYEPKTALGVAEDAASLKLLVEAGAHMSPDDYYGQTALANAVSKGWEEAVQFWISQGADTIATVPDIGTAMDIAIERRHDKVAQMILDTGIRVDWDMIRSSSLWDAIADGRVRVPSTDVDFRDDSYDMLEHEGTSPKNVTAALKALTDAGDINIGADTALMAPHDTTPGLIEEVVSYADLKARERRYLTGPTLLGFGTALHCVALLGGPETEIAGQELISAGADIHARHMGIAVIHEASRRNNMELVSLLLGVPSVPDAAGLSSYTGALQSAASLGYVDVAKLLLEAGVNVNASFSGATALQHAAYWGQADAVKMLIDAGADVDADGERWGTALHAASARQRIDVVKILRKAGAVLGEEQATCVSCRLHREYQIRLAVKNDFPT